MPVAHRQGRARHLRVIELGLFSLTQLKRFRDGTKLELIGAFARF
jgi:hypothetical protein